MSRATSPTPSENTPPNASNALLARRRRTFGVLLDRMALYPSGYEEELRRQFHAAAVALDVNLRILYGEAVAPAAAEASGANAIYELLTPESIDGLVAVSSSLDAGCGAPRLAEFLSRYRPLPICSVGIELPGVPSIVVSGAAAVERLVIHLIEDHGVRSVLFLEGRPAHTESLERRAACESVTQRLLGRSPLVKTGHFSRSGAYLATLEALDQELEFDAVVAANDHMALGAFGALSERGLGRKRAVTGFDDLDLARACCPPLTTVAQPFKDVAFTALSHLLSELEGAMVPAYTQFSAELVLRQSCGCPELLRASSRTALEPQSPSPLFDHSRQILEATALASGVPPEPFVSRLLGALNAELEQTESALVSVLEQRDRAGVARALRATLSAGGLGEVCVSTFADVERRQLEPLAARPDAGGAQKGCFPAVDLVPSWWQSDARRRTLLLLPLAIEDTCFGVAAFSYPCAGCGPQIITKQAALAMRNVALHEAMIEQTIRSERSAQERRAAAQRLESIGALAGSVAHELNNALGPLVALPEVMLEELGSLSGDPDVLENLRQDVESIRAAAERATGTILDLLTLGRRGHIPNCLIDLNQSAADAARSRAADGRSPCTLELDLYDGELMVSASPNQISRALGHLIKNAEQATLEGGTLGLRTSRVSLHEPLHGYETIPPNRYGVIEVADDGAELQEGSLARLFEPYYANRTPGDGGSKSLGLALVHAVVKEHEGFIDVEKRPVRGTAFRLYFPLANAHSEPAHTALHCSTETGSLEGLRILVVDDELTQLKTAERLLRRYGCQVETVSNGDDAYQRFRDPKTALGYDLVLLDVTLNEVSDGIDWLERIQAAAPGQQCILMSGHATPARAQRALGKGVPWLVKPYTPEALVAMVGSVLTKGPVSPRFSGE